MTAIAFAGSWLDRADPVRSDPAALARLLEADPRFLDLDGLDPVLGEDGLSTALAWRPRGSADEDCVFLGLDAEGRGHFAALPALPPGGSPHAGPASWKAMAVLGEGDLAVYGAARALVGWHARHRFCAVCGSPSQATKGGWQRTCASPECGAEHFPRVDPVTIMLVEHEGNLLLGRQPRFQPGQYSALAGFVEPGETIEEAVAREVFEEAGVTVRDVRYVASQPWPYPSSLMIGCHSYADDPAITIDRTELEDARWFSRADVADAMEAIARGESGRAFKVPPRSAVAHVLVRWWLEQGA